MPHLLQLVSKNPPVDVQRQSLITRTFLCVCLVCYIDSPATPPACGTLTQNLTVVWRRGLNRTDCVKLSFGSRCVHIAQKNKQHTKVLAL